jgi:hypothetical protein
MRLLPLRVLRLGFFQGRDGGVGSQFLQLLPAQVTIV